MSDDKCLSYWVDQNDRIVKVGGAWDEAARDGGSDSLFADSVKGTNLFSYIAGEATRSFVWTMIDAVRKLQRPNKRPYRCDTPTLKRSMEMTIIPEGNGLLRLEHRLVATEPLQRPLSFRSAHRLDYKPPLRLRCSMCNQVRIGQVWREPDEHAKLLNTLETTPVVYSVCDDCREAAGRVHSAA